MTKIYLGTVQIEEDERLVLPAIDLSSDPASITAALEAAEAKRVADRVAESERLREMFLQADDKPPEDTPAPKRDWLFP